MRREKGPTIIFSMPTFKSPTGGSTVTPERHSQLKEIYLFVFDVFATDKSEVARQFGISGNSALTALKRLEEAHLVCRMGLSDIGGGMSVDSNGQPKNLSGSFKELTWQAWQTYDDHTRGEALGHFLAALPTPQPTMSKKDKAGLLRFDAETTRLCDSLGIEVPA